MTDHIEIRYGGIIRRLTAEEWIEAADHRDAYLHNKSLVEFIDGASGSINEFLHSINFNHVTITAEFVASDSNGRDDWPYNIEVEISGSADGKPIEVEASDWGSLPTEDVIREVLAELLRRAKND